MTTNVSRPVTSSNSGRPASRWDDARAGVQLVLAMLAVMWVAWIVNALDHYHLDRDGILPRNVGHLWGIATAPFLHASFAHIFSNTIPFLILGSVIALGGGVARVGVVTVVTILISGAGVWLISGSGTSTIGASGVVFGFATYLVARGIFSRNILELLIGAVVGALFGLSLLSDLIPRSGVSWQDHLFGAVAGVIAAALLTRKAERHPADATGRTVSPSRITPG